MARTQQGVVEQFMSLPAWGRVAFVLVAGSAFAAGWLLPKWLTLVGLLGLFLGVFVVQKLRGKT